MSKFIKMFKVYTMTLAIKFDTVVNALILALALNVRSLWSVT